MKRMIICRLAPAIATILVMGLAVPASSQTASYTYDKLNRLTSATISGSRIEYQYDSAGNILRVLTPYSIELTKSGTGTSSITDDLGKIDCGDDCSGVYDLNTVVTLTAVPEAGTTFSGWSGACTGTGTCVVTVDGAESVGASFVTAGSDFSITKDDGVDTASPGESVTYTVVVNNSGPGAVGDAEVSDVIPAGLTCTWTSVAAGGATGSAESGSGDISETLNLPSGASVTYTVVCDTDPASTGTLSNTATVSSAVTDPTPDDHSATDTTALAPSADLWLTAELSSTETAPSAAVTATLDVGNRGPSTATLLVVENALPAGASFDSASGTGWSCGESGGVVTCNRDALGPTTSTEITINMTMPANPASLTNSATVSSATTESAPGDESDTVSVELFAPPTITGVTSVAATENGLLIEGASSVDTLASLTQILLEASHELNDETGDAGANDVTNPECYRLFQADAEGNFGSTTCAEDSDLPIDAASYGVAADRTVALAIGGGSALTSGRYRLVACASGSTFLQDIYGSALDGDADGTAGDDFVLDFRVQVTNLLVNPNLDEDLNGWTVLSEADGDVTHDAVIDVADAETSGSARLANLIGEGSVLEISQCVPVAEGERYQVGLSALAASVGTEFPEIRGVVEIFDDTQCAGISLGMDEAFLLTGDSGDLWVDQAELMDAAPAGALSALVTFRVSGDEYYAETWLDDLQYLHGIVILINGFESGDDSGWSASVGGQ